MAYPATCHLTDPQKRIIEGTEDYLTPPTIGWKKQDGGIESTYMDRRAGIQMKTNTVLADAAEL